MTPNYSTVPRSAQISPVVPPTTRSLVKEAVQEAAIQRAQRRKFPWHRHRKPCPAEYKPAHQAAFAAGDTAGDRSALKCPELRTLRLHDKEAFESLNASFHYHSAKPYEARLLRKTTPPQIS